MVNDVLCDGPRGDDVVHDPFAERLGHVVQLHELPDAVEHVVVAARRAVHLLEDRRHVTEDGGVQQRFLLLNSVHLILNPVSG